MQDKNYEKKMTVAFLVSFVMLIVAFFLFPKLAPKTNTSDADNTNTTITDTTNTSVASETVTNKIIAMTAKPLSDEDIPATNVTISFGDTIYLDIENEGARIVGLWVDGEWNQLDEPKYLMSVSNDFWIADLVFDDHEFGIDVDERPFYRLVEMTSNSATFMTELSYDDIPIEVTRVISVSSNYSFSDTVTIRNLSANMMAMDKDGVSFSVVNQFGLFAKEEANPRNRVQYRYFDGDKLQEALKSGLIKNLTGNAVQVQEVANPYWLTYSDNYFIAAIVPGANTYTGWYDTLSSEKNYKEVALVLENENFNLNAGESKTFDFTYYVGPKKEELMRIVNPQFKKLYDWPAVFNWLMRPISWLIKKGMFLLGSVIPNYGLVIIILALIIKLILSPLSIKSAISMRKTQMAQPKLKNIQEKYKDNPQVMQQKTMEYYKKEGINPLGGCWPMLLQIPVFFSLFRVLSDSVELKGAKFLWIKDLTLPDTLFTMNVPLLPNQFNLLPILMTVIQLIQTRLQMGRNKQLAGQQQNPMNSYLMPVMFLFLFWNMPAGLVLYWTIQNIYSIIEQQLIRFDKHIQLK